MSGWLRPWLVPLTLVLVAGLASPMLLEAYINRTVFYPEPGLAIDPSGLGRPVESVEVTTEDGVRIHGFYLPESGARSALLYLHGNAGNASHRLPTAVEMAALGINVLVLDYRGYGLSEGRPSESGVYRDARAGLAELNRRGFDNRNIVVFGRSLGGAIAVDLLTERSVAGLILCSTFSSAADMASAMGLGLLAPLVARRFNSIAKIPKVSAPILFLHGTEDEIVPYALGRRLFEAAPSDRRWVDLPLTGHNDVMTAGAPAFWPALRGFLERVVPLRPG